MRKLSEGIIQQDCVVHFHNNYCLPKHNPRCVIYSIPNESENAYETQKKVNLGLLRGASDTVVLLPGAKSIYMECKTDTGYQSKYQKQFEENVKALGFEYHVFRSKEQFYNILNPHLAAAGLEVYNG